MRNSTSVMTTKKIEKIPEDVAQKAHEVYSGLQKDVPDTFKNPHLFNKDYKPIDPEMDPHQLYYRSSNNEYGNFAPELIDMPTHFKGKSESFIKGQNYQVFRDSRMNCASDKARFMNPTTTIRRK